MIYTRATLLREAAKTNAGSRARQVVGLTAALSAVALAGNGCTLELDERKFRSLGTFEQRYAGPGITELVIETNVGYISIESWAESDFQIVAEVHVPEELAAQLSPARAERDLHLLQQNSLLRIADAHRKAPDHNDWRVDLTVRVPALTSVVATTAVGNVTADGNYKQVQLKTAAGDILFSGNIAELSATTGVGNLNFSGTYENATLRAGTGNISMTSDQLGSAELVTGVGNLSASVRKGPTGSLSCKAGTGSIDLELADAWSGTFDIRTGLGDIEMPTELSNAVAAGVVNATATGKRGTGAAAVELKTGVGSIRWEDHR